MQTYCVLLTQGGPHLINHAVSSSLAPRCHPPHLRGKKTEAQLLLVTLSTDHLAEHMDS